MEPRQPRGIPTGGQFAPHSRKEASVALIEPLSDFDRKRAEKALDRARNGFGYAITPDARARVILFLERPTHRHWESARTIMLAGPMMSLWRAAVEHGDEPTVRDGAQTPTRNAVLIGLEVGTRESPPTFTA